MKRNGSAHERQRSLSACDHSRILFPELLRWICDDGWNRHREGGPAFAPGLAFACRRLVSARSRSASAFWPN